MNLSIHALKSLFNYLTKETENEDGKSYFYRNVMSKIVLHTKKETASRRAQKISSTILNEQEICEFLHFIEFEYEELLESGIARQRFKRDKERDLAILSLFLDSGIRLAETAGILTKKVNLKKNLIDIKRKGAKEDTMNIMDEAIEHLQAYLSIRDTRYKGAKYVPFLFVTVLPLGDVPYFVFHPVYVRFCNPNLGKNNRTPCWSVIEYKLICSNNQSFI